MKVGLIGCGAIGSLIARALPGLGIKLVVAFDIDKERARRLLAEPTDTEIAGDIDEFLHKRVDLVVEAASAQAVRDYGERVIEVSDLMLMSTAAFAIYPELHRLLEERARKFRRRIYLPSGAIVGLDGVKAAQGLIEQVTLTTTKNPAAIEQVEYLTERGIILKDLRESEVLFSGPASEGAKLFPKNLNVLSTLALCGLGMEGTTVKLVADPQVDHNIHELTVKGEFGRFTTKTVNLPSEENPRTSQLAALSAIATLKKIKEPFQIGT